MRMSRASYVSSSSKSVVVLRTMAVAVSLLTMTCNHMATAFVPARTTHNRMIAAAFTTCCIRRNHHDTTMVRLYQSSSSTTTTSSSSSSSEQQQEETEPPMYLAQGLFAVNKPLEWTSQDMVSYVRKMLERDCRERGVKVERVRKRGGNKKRMLKVGHGGTLDPLATGVLVIGVGSGTKQLQSYLNGAKRYTAHAKLGFETTTLDMEGEVVKTAPFDQITQTHIRDILPSFTGTILQVPPVFSAIKRNGRKMYEEAREGKTAEDLDIPPREVQVYVLDLLEKEGETTSDANSNDEETDAGTFALDVECGGGTYIRTLVRDIGVALGTVATMTGLVRTKQGPFELKHVLPKEDMTPDNIYAAIDHANNEILTANDSN